MHCNLRPPDVAPVVLRFTNALLIQLIRGWIYDFATRSAPSRLCSQWEGVHNSHVTTSVQSKASRTQQTNHLLHQNLATEKPIEWWSDPTWRAYSAPQTPSWFTGGAGQERERRKGEDKKGRGEERGRKRGEKGRKGKRKVEGREGPCRQSQNRADALEWLRRWWRTKPIITPLSTSSSCLLRRRKIKICKKSEVVLSEPLGPPGRRWSFL